MVVILFITHSVLRYLYLFSLADGQCLTSLQASDSFTREQLAPKDRDVLFETYIWCHLQVTTTQQVNGTVNDEFSANA